MAVAHLFLRLAFYTMARFFGRTDLRIGASKAKFDARLDFQVYFAPAPQNLTKIGKSYVSQYIFSPTEFFGGRNIKCWELSETCVAKV